MRPLLIFLLVIAHTADGQTNRREYISISIDSVKKIKIIDHQNLNYNWFYGRIYEITKSDDAFILTRTDQYSKPFIFGAPSLETTADATNVDKMALLDKFNITKNKDSLTLLANSAVSSRHSWYSDRIKLENANEPEIIGEIEKSKIEDLMVAINVQKETYINYILSSLEIDSSWLAKNASRLWESYKPENFKITEKSKQYCIKCLKNLEYAKTASYSIQGFNSSDYPFVEIQLIMEKDTAFVNTDGIRPFMLPWNINNKYKSFNPKLSIALGNILPYDDSYTNKHRLLGSKNAKEHSFEGLLAHRIIFEHCVENYKRKKLRVE